MKASQKSLNAYFYMNIVRPRPQYLCSKTATVLLEWTIPRIMDVSILQFYCII